MAGKDERRDYRSFLMRMWRNEESGWRFSLEDTLTGIREGFTSLGMLMDFFSDLIRSQDQPEEDDREG